MQSLKEKEYKCLLSESIRKTALFDANCMKIGFLLLKLLRFYDFKMAANGGRHFEINIKLKIIKLYLFLKSMHTHTHLTNVIFVYYANNLFMWLFYEICTFIRHYWKKSISIVRKWRHNLTDFLVPSFKFLNFQSSITSLFNVRFAWNLHQTVWF